MDVVFSREPFPERVVKTLFLAGPTPRGGNAPSWRPQALETLREIGFSGTVFVPEDRDFIPPVSLDGNAQITWERRCLAASDRILFWLPRSDALPGFTTNIEFGAWANSGKIVVGIPPEAAKCGYIRHVCKERGIACHAALEGALEKAVAEIGEGAAREGWQAHIPFDVFTSPQFREHLAELPGKPATLRMEMRHKIPCGGLVWLAVGVSTGPDGEAIPAEMLGMSG